MVIKPFPIIRKWKIYIYVALIICSAAFLITWLISKKCNILPLDIKPLDRSEYGRMIAKTDNDQMKGIAVTIHYIWFTKEHHPNPIALLRFLATNPDVIVQHLTRPNVSLKLEIYSEWINKNDIEALINYIKSNQPAASIESGLTTFPHKSTVGKEAILMIEAFRQRPYPQGLGKNGYPPNEFTRGAIFKEKSAEERVTEILQWWKSEKEITSR